MGLLWQHEQSLRADFSSCQVSLGSFRRKLKRAEEELQKSTKRAEKKKAKYKIIRHKIDITGLEAQQATLMENLRLCQLQLHNMQLALAAAYYPYSPAPTYYPYPPVSAYPSFAQQQPNLIYHDLSRMRDSSPASHTNTDGSGADSGFHGPAMYAQPLDLDLSYQEPQHLFAHEMLATPPQNAAPEYMGYAIARTPAVPASIEASAATFGSPTTATFNEVRSERKKHERRYSEAAIQLVELRLRHPRSPLTPKFPKGWQRRGRSMDLKSPLDSPVSSGVSPKTVLSPAVLSPRLEKVVELEA